jgi:beta-propeller repeat-containing protein
MRSTMPSTRAMVQLAAMAAGLLLLSTLVSAATAPTHTPAPVWDKPNLIEAYGKLPLMFEANRGQTDRRVKFLSRGPGYTLFLTPTEAVLALRGRETVTRSSATSPRPTEGEGQGEGATLRMQFKGANPTPRASGLEPLPGIVNYFIGNDPKRWRTNIPTYQKVQYQNVYPGIDLVYYGSNQRQLEYDFVVRPGADPNEIVLGFQGVDRLEVNTQGDLVLHTAAGPIRQRKPVIYQEVDGVRTAIAGGYVLNAPSQVSFQLAAYDRSRPLIIDPVLVYSTYLGGSVGDGGNGIAVDAAGAAYVTGGTNSPDFTAGCTAPCTVLDGSFGGVQFGESDAFVTKLNATGTALVYSTYLGGGFGPDVGSGIAVDASGAAYVTGFTGSPDFNAGCTAPCTVLDASLGSALDAFVTKLNSLGNGLVYSTYLGGSGIDSGSGIAVDAAGAAYVTGATESMDFTAGCTAPCTVLDSTGGGPSGSRRSFDAFVTKLNATGTALIYSTYLGGSSSDGGRGIAVDASGAAYVTGSTESTDFTAGCTAPCTVLDSTGGGPNRDAFLTKLNATGTALIYSTYLGGSLTEDGVGIAVDAAGAAYATGLTTSADFTEGCTAPCTVLDASLGGDEDAFVTKLNATGTALVYSTFLGGGSFDDGRGIAVDASGAAAVTGLTFSPDFTAGCTAPCTVLDASLGGAQDAFVTKLNSLGNGLVYSTYLGGSGTNNEIGLGIAVDAAGAAYVTGSTSSTDFTTTTGAFQTTLGGGGGDAFVTKIAEIGSTATLTLQPPADTNPVNTQHCVTATVEDAGGNPTLGITVRFTVTGSVTTSEAATTNEGGQATFCYTGPQIAGADTITAYTDMNNNAVQDPSESTGTATKTWVAGASSPGKQLQDLIHLVDQMNLPKSMQNRLIHALDRTLKDLDDTKKPGEACKDFERVIKFIKDVQNKKGEKDLTADEAADLFNRINEIETSLGC